MDERHITSKIISSQVEEIIIPKNKGNIEMFSGEEETMKHIFILKKM